MRPNRLELCITCPGVLAGNCNSCPEAKHPSPSRRDTAGIREPCYATGKEGLHEIQVDFFDFGAPRMERRERTCVENLMATEDVGDSQIPPIVTSSQNRSNTCIMGFLGCVATNYVTPQLVPLLETVRTVIPANPFQWPAFATAKPSSMKWCLHRHLSLVVPGAVHQSWLFGIGLGHPWRPVFLFV